MVLPEEVFWRVKSELTEAELLKYKANELLMQAETKTQAIFKELKLDKNKTYKLNVETKEITEG